jgi:hypothetical protein
MDSYCSGTCAGKTVFLGCTVGFQGFVRDHALGCLAGALLATVRKDVYVVRVATADVVLGEHGLKPNGSSVSQQSVVLA